MWKKCTAVVLLPFFILFLSACASSSDEFFEIGEDRIPTLYTVASGKKVTGSSSGFENGVSYRYVQYGEGITVDEMQQYIDALQGIGYAQIGETEINGDEQKILMGNNSVTEGKKVLINITLNPVGTTQIDYTVSDGYIGRVGAGFVEEG